MTEPEIDVSFRVTNNYIHMHEVRDPRDICRKEDNHYVIMESL